MILYEDDFLVAANKPNNMLVHHSAMAKNKIDEQTLIEALKIEHGEKLIPLHRLDRKTSGIILLAKDKKNVATFQELFTTDTIQKTYYGIVRGFSPDEGTIDTPVKGRDAKKHRDALTHFKTTHTIELDIAVGPYETSRYSLVELYPKTGRLHQLRIHTKKINHPLLGDPKYGDKAHNLMFEREFNNDIMLLHAGKLSFKHPFINKAIELKADFPKPWFNLFEKFNWKSPQD